MKKLFLTLALVFACWMIGPKGAYAAAVPLPSKATYALNYTTTVSTVTTTHSCVYQVIMSSGTASEFVAFFDTAPVAGGQFTANSEASSANLKLRLLFSSTTANTGNPYKFDPPLLFANGIQVADSAATGQTLISYDYGDCGSN